MKRLKEFRIELARLKPGKHHFNYKIDSGFFENFEYGLVEKGDLSADIKIDKSVTMLNIDFDIEGTIELICDRSLEPFDYELSIQNSLVVKFGEGDKDLSDDVIVIKYETQFLNLADFIYEFITVAVPMKKLHPKFEGEEDEEVDSLVYTSDEGDSEKSQENEDDIDPRWKELLKLKNNK